jgi:hypothetical protein
LIKGSLSLKAVYTIRGNISYIVLTSVMRNHRDGRQIRRKQPTSSRHSG